MPFRKKSSGSGGGDSFTTIQTDAGTYPVADSSSDVLTLTSSDGSLSITGNNTTDTIDLTVVGGGGGAPSDATYVTLSTNATLTNERVLTGTANQITITDNGAGSTVVLSTPQNIHTGASPTFTGLTLSGLTQGSVLFAGSGGVISQDNANLFYNDTTNTLIVGDPGSEGSGINLNGTTDNAVLKISDIGAGNRAEIILHRHSTTLPPSIIAARANSDTSSHAAVTAGQDLLIFGVSGWTGSHYDTFASLRFLVDSGTISSTSAPGRFDFYLTPNGSDTPAIVLTGRQDKTIEMPGYTAGFAKFNGSGVISSSTIASTDLSDFNEAVDDRVDTLIQDGTGLTWTYNDGANTLTGNVSLSAFSTTDLAEGTNLYYTDERVDDRVAALIQNGTGISWSYSDAGGTLTPTVSLASFSTTNLSEGTNLYYTDERVDDRVAALIQNGTGISWSYSDAGGTLTPTISLASFSTTNLSEGTNLYFTDERAQDAVGTIFVDSTKIDFTYTDATPSITATIVADSLVNADINSAAAIARSKLASGTADHVVINSGAGAFSSEANLAVSRGGTGAGTLTANNVILGNGTGAVQFVAPGSSGNVLTSNGTTWTSAAPAGASISIGSTVTGGTATRVLFVDTGPVLADDSGLTFNKTSNVLTPSGGVSGGSANTDNLSIYANDTAYAHANTGSILLKHRLKFQENFTATTTVNEAFINLTSTLTSAEIINIFVGYKHAPTINVSVAQTLSTAPAFLAAPAFVHTAANLTDSVTYYQGFQSIPSFNTTAASGTSTAEYLTGYDSKPKILKTGAASVVVSNVIGFGTYSSPFIFGGDDWAAITVTEFSAFRAIPPIGNTATATHYYGFRHSTTAAANTITKTNEYAFASNTASASTAWNLYFTGTAKSFMQGGLRIGDSSPTQPTEKLEVVGNIVAGLASTTTGQLHLYRSASANAFKMQAHASTGAWTMTLPSSAGTANYFLQTDGSGNTTWASASGGSSPLTTKGDIYTYSTADARLAVGTDEYFLVADSSQTTGLRWNGRVKAKTTSDSAGKTSDNTITSADTVAALACTLVTGKKYKITGLLLFTSTSATPDAKMQFRDDGAIVVAQLNAVLSYATPGTTTTAQCQNASVGAVNTDSDPIQVNTTGTTACSIMGFVDVTTGGTLDIAWAQNTSNATAVVLKAGSWIHYEEI